ncbi:hypothetical protein ACFYXH_41895 [Streptomyces sp. NPDC002730]|uniref:hypothetical protein n=1 Tax=Streptomyces sp. NPDC002730 TaxID=3364662 RepID=UPI0036D03F6A
MTAPTADRAECWFTAAHPDPSQLAIEWQQHPRWTAQFPAGRMRDAIAMPQALADDVVEVLGSLLVDQHTPILADLRNRRVYFFTDPGQGGIWVGQDVWTLSTGTWLTAPHPLNGPYDCPTVWRRRPHQNHGPLAVSDLRMALRLVYPAYRRRIGSPQWLTSSGGIL